MADHAGRAVFEVGIADPRGNRQAGATVIVYERGTTNPVTLYTDRTKTTELADNTTSTDSLGNLEIYADPGDYDADVGGGVIRFTVLPDWEDTVTTDQSAAGLPGHLADPADAHDASAVSFVPGSGIAATNVQSAVVEVAVDAAASLAALDAALPSIYPSIADLDAEEAARLAADAALDVRIDTLEAGGGYDPNAVTVLRFTGQVAVHVNHGPFWPPGVDLGVFVWDSWMVNDNGYLISDGNGGGHCLLWGGLRSGTTVSVSGNMWDGSTPLVTFGADDTTDQTEWAHHGVGWDGAFIYYWLDGLCSGKVAYTRARRAQYGQLYVAGSDHQNFTGKLSQLRGFEDSFPTTTPLLGFVPERYLSPFDQLGNTASFLANYMVPGQVIIPDLSDGYNGRVHPGAIHAGPDISGHIAISSGAFAGVPEVAGRPSWEVDPTAPFDVAAAIVPTGAIAAIPSLPVGVDTYDSFNRAKQNRTMVFPTLGTTDARASLGAQTWLYGLTGDSRLSLWGIINGCAVCLYAQGAAREIAWVPRSAAGAGMDVRVDRRSTAAYGTHETGLAIRVASNTDHFAVFTRNDTSPTAATVDVYKNVAGTLTDLTPTPFTCPLTAWTTLRAVMPTGSTTLTVYVDDLAGGWTQIGQITGLTDHSTAKGAGIANYHLSSLPRHDNFRVLAA